MISFSDFAGLLKDHAVAVFYDLTTRSPTRPPYTTSMDSTCAQPAVIGGASIVIDGYALFDILAVGLPELHAFLQGTDVDFFGAWTNNSTAVSPTPRTCRMLEWTRAGRPSIRANREARPAPRSPWAAHLANELDAYADVLTTLESMAPHKMLDAKDMMIINIYR